MKGQNIFVSGIAVGIILLLAAGCNSVVKIETDSVKPPRVIKDMKGIDTIEIAAKVSLSGNKISKGDDSTAERAVSQKLASGFGNLGVYKTTDMVWGSPAGAADLLTLVKSYGSHHGYARFATDSAKPRARLEVTLTLKINSGVKNLNVFTPLKKVFYATKYRRQTITWGRGERKNRENIQIPYSIPVKTVSSRAQSKIKQYWVSANGVLSAKMIDKKGKVVYQRTFKNLKYEAVCDHKNLQALPNNIQILSAVSRDAVEAIVKDLAPYKMREVWQINSGGNERASLLLQAMAFSEAVEAYENIKEDERTFMDWENLGIVYAILGDFEGAESCFNTALKIKKEEGGLFSGDKQIAEKGIQQIGRLAVEKEKLAAK